MGGRWGIVGLFVLRNQLKATEMGALKMFFEGSFVPLKLLSTPGGGPLPFLEEAPENPKAISHSTQKAAAVTPPSQIISTHLL